MYLGGNGFYWRIATHRSAPGVLEVRRAEGGMRAWAAEPGEFYPRVRRRLRRTVAPHRAAAATLISGIGFSSQGKFESGLLPPPSGVEAIRAPAGSSTASTTT